MYPRLDEAVTRATGTPHESLDRLVDQQPFVPGPIALSEDALHALPRAWSGELRGERDGAPFRELVEAGLIGRTGRITAVGTAHVEHLAAPRRQLWATADSVDGSMRSLVWIGASSALVAAQTEPSGAFFLEVVPLDRVATVTARWLGLAPAWILADGPVSVERAVVDARVHDPGVAPPAAAGPLLRRSWASPWHRLTVVTRPTAGGFDVIKTGAAGYLLVRQADGGDVVLEPTDPEPLFLTLLRAFSTV